MAGKDRTATSALALLEALEREPFQYDLFHLLRRLECEFSDKPRLGESLRAADDPIRLGEQPHLDFSAAMIAACVPGTEGRPWRVLLNWGLLGPNGPLPLHLTEYIRDRLRNSGDPVAARFLDVFHHRMLSLLYRTWAAAQPAVQFDRPDTDRFINYAGSIIGLGMESLRDRDAFPDMAKLHFAGMFACHTRHPGGLEAVLTGVFGVPVAVQEFVGHWLPLPPDCRGRLTAGASALGHTATLGTRVWDCQSKFRVVCGPLDYADFCRLLPDGDRFAELVAGVRNYAGDEMLWDLQLVLRKDEKPALQLGRTGRLQRNAWLCRGPLERDSRDLVLGPMRPHYSVT
ncbi:MAG TPA: type VI secretion system baseplate subunit TssG [Pirellulales bacterium]|nr:type VI secretion system baseplate subunit TssG [Pirellulales bacterium]